MGQLLHVLVITSAGLQCSSRCLHHCAVTHRIRSTASLALIAKPCTSRIPQPPAALLSSAPQAAQVLFQLRAVYRDHGPRLDRQKTRLMWMVEDMGVAKFRELVESYMGDKLREAVHPQVLMPVQQGRYAAAPLRHERRWSGSVCTAAQHSLATPQTHADGEAQLGLCLRCPQMPDAAVHAVR